jgi:Mn2+/Fe2+ NRAMP family transporter
MSISAVGPRQFNWGRFFAVAGPGLVVMLADTNAGSVITAAQSDAQRGYSLLLLQFILIPILYIVQELTVRLGVPLRWRSGSTPTAQAGIRGA